MGLIIEFNARRSPQGHKGRVACFDLRLHVLALAQETVGFAIRPPLNACTHTHARRRRLRAVGAMRRSTRNPAHPTGDVREWFFDLSFITLANSSISFFGSVWDSEWFARDIGVADAL